MSVTKPCYQSYQSYLQTVVQEPYTQWSFKQHPSYLEILENVSKEYGIQYLYLIEQEELYSPNPHYIDQCQPSLKWKMRSILLDWMQEVCSDYLLKRETFYYAVNFVDRYLSIVPNVEKKTLNLIIYLRSSDYFLANGISEKRAIVMWTTVPDFRKSK